ncbi:MAG: SpaH/EbpB family LPXTG-anchored major pilin [Eubacteriales bacterium]|nr:SpaH/EbpB family LPXTG-anchored major pilin [Eubacteriales bacterium]
MKHIKKLASLCLALVMVCTMAVTAFAAGGTGTITVDNAVKGQTYTIYEILKLESYDTASNAYAYKATTAWTNFINSDAIKGKYVNVDAQGYVTWIEGKSAADFAKLAQAYAKTNSIGHQGSTKATGDTVKFTDLELGYYLLDSSLGTLCSLNTTKPNVTIKEKNAEPTNVKTVEEDSTGNYGEKNDADIGQTVNFKSTITAQAGAENYVFHDKMSTGLTFNGSVSVTLNGETVDSSNYTFRDYTAEGVTTPTDGCTFEVVFTEAFCNSLQANDKIVISYSATVNENAVVGGNGNSNTSKLSYGDTTNIKTTPDSTTKTYTWSFDVLKYGNGDETKVLEGAKFVLLNKDKTKVATIVNGKLTGWVDVPTAGTDGTITWPANTTLTTSEQGKIDIAGLDADTYYLREVEAPKGYNKLTNDFEVTIAPTEGTDANGNKTLTLPSVTAKVNNQSGTELPSTGGMGTTLFYIIGGVLVVGAGVLLITKKRMSSDK